VNSGTVEVDDLVMRYGGVTAVAGVSFKIAAGEHVTLLGPSGCGKTTTLRAVAGLERPASGRISIGGEPLLDRESGIDLPPERRGLSMVFQSYAIWPHMSVFDNVAFPLRVRRVARAETRKRVEQALALVDLAGFGDRPATRLSGGQQQRVALARAVVHESRLVLFDEPLSNLDAQLRSQMRTELVDLRARLGLTALYVTHDQSEAFALSDRIIVMREGLIEQEGAPAEIHAAPRSLFVARFLGIANIHACEIGGGSSDGTATARLANGLCLKARDPWGNGEAGRGFVAFRAGSVSFTRPAPGGQGGSGTLAHSLFLGDTTQSRIRCGDVEVIAETRGIPSKPQGAEIGWSVDPADCVLLRR
jgi:ABC-type Fe3+/spermidine/putrescine transport system ATPase subunit